jgi:macrolide-specific efflux system membrane fusion protein
MNTKFKIKNIKWMALATLIILALIILVIGLKSKDEMYDKEVVKPGSFKVQIITTGTVKSENEVEVKVPISGRVEKILVTEGQRVKKDQVLFYISSSERAALLDAARARGVDEFKEWEQNYKMTPIFAPIDGTIIQKRFEPGQTFSAESTVLVMSDRLTVKAKVDETDIGRILSDQKAEIVLDAYQDKKIAAKVDQIAFDAVIENSVTSYVVDVLPKKAPAYMRSGMTANVTIDIASKDNVISVPIAAIFYKEDKSFVLLENSHGDNSPIEREVKLGITQATRAEVTDGLKVGEIVLIKKFPFPIDEKSSAD